MTLAELIQNDPDERGYADETNPAIIAADLSEKRHTVRRPVQWEVYFKRLWDLGLFSLIVQQAAEGNAACQAAVLQSEKARAMGLMTLDLDSMPLQSLFDALSAALPEFAAARPQLEALADMPASLAEMNGLPAVIYPEDVQRAMGG